MSRRTALLILAAALASASCAGKPFDVKRIQPVAPETLGVSAAAGALGLRARAIWDEDWLLETLDANTILAGVLPVRIDLENRGTAPLDVSHLDVELAGAAPFKRLDPKKAMKRIEKYYEITLSSTTGRKVYREDFLANTLAIEAPLAPGEHRQGLVFFEIPRDAARPAPTTLTLRNGASSASVGLEATGRLAGEN